MRSQRSTSPGRRAERAPAGCCGRRSDKGVVAVLEPRLVTAASCAPHSPPYWTTYDPEVVRAALKRLDAAQTP
jgi:hypothetical protein